MTQHATVTNHGLRRLSNPLLYLSLNTSHTTKTITQTQKTPFPMWVYILEVQ